MAKVLLFDIAMIGAARCQSAGGISHLRFVGHCRVGRALYTGIS